MKLTFWGAARTVTGSMHHVETGGKAISSGLRVVSGTASGSLRAQQPLSVSGGGHRGGDPFARPHRPQRQPADAGSQRVSRGRSTRRQRQSICVWRCWRIRRIFKKRTRSSAIAGERTARPSAGTIANARRSTRSRTPSTLIRCFSRCSWRTERSSRAACATGLMTLGTCSGRRHLIVEADGMRLAFLGRRGTARPAHHPRSPAAGSGGLPDHGEHLRRPAAQTDRTRGGKTGRGGEPDG